MTLVIGLTLLSLVFLLSACSDDEGTVSVETSSTGIVNINPSPEDLNATWTMTGPDGIQETGSGTAQFVDMPLGDYSITWTPVLGWFTPDDLVRTLQLGGAYVYLNGRYGFMGVGSIDLDLQSEAGVGSWNIDGVEDLDFEGSDDAILEDLVPGEYALTWTTVEGMISPADSNMMVVRDEIATYAGRYGDYPAEVAGMVVIPPTDIRLPSNFILGDEATHPHEVVLTQRVYFSQYEVTNQEFVNFLNEFSGVSHTDTTIVVAVSNYNFKVCNRANAPSVIPDGAGYTTDQPNRPVTGVSWYGAALYCNWLSEDEGLQPPYGLPDFNCNEGDPYGAEGYRLATEAEWDYACNGLVSTMFNFGECLSSDIHGNFDGTVALNDCAEGPFLDSLVDVGQYQPNSWGLYDMYGNAPEWINDWFGAFDNEAINPVGAEIGTEKMLKGGDYTTRDQRCRAARRAPVEIDDDVYGGGFRVVRSVPW